MPHILINKLKKLMAANLSGCSDPDDLGSCSNNYSDSAFQQIDDIGDTARALFGRRVEPSAGQKRAIEENGFKVVCRASQGSTWLKGAIVTPSGKIKY